MSKSLLRRTVALTLACALALAGSVSGAGGAIVPPTAEIADRFELLDVVGSVSKGSCVVGDRLYTVGGTGLAVWDITEPASPVRLGKAVFEGGRQIVVSGTHAFVVTTSGALASFDITDPAAPTHVSTLAAAVSSPKSIDAIAMAGDIVYLSGNGRIYTVDVSNPASMVPGAPFLVGQTGGNWCIDVDGTRLAAANSENIAYFDVAVPSAPATLTLTPFASLQAGGIDLVGGTLFLGSYNVTTYGFATFDVSGAPTMLMDNHTNGTWFGSVAVDAAGTAHVISDGDVLSTFDVGNPADIATLGEASPGITGNLSPVDVGLDGSGSAAYWCDARYGLFAFDVTTPAVPVDGTFFNTPDYAQDVVVSGGAMYVADTLRGIVTYDISDPSAPVPTSEIALSNVYGLRVHDGLLLANRSESSGQFTVLDLTDPLDPVVADSIAVPASSYGDDVAAVGDRAYVVAGSSVRVIDISDPYDLSEAGVWTGSFEYSAIDATGTIAVVGATSGSMQALDISSDTPVALGGSVGAWDMVNDLLMDGDKCYVATNGVSGGYGLLQLGLSPAGLGGIEYYGFPTNTESIRGLALTPERRLVAAGQNGVYTWAVPMTQNFQPPVASYAPLTSGQAVSLDGPTAFVGAQYNGVYVFDGPDFTGPAITVTGVDDGAVYDGPVSPSVTFGADATDTLIELNDDPWVPTTISEPGVYNLATWAEDVWGNETNRPLREFRILTGDDARLAGDDRYETSAEISARTFKTADTVVIATGRNYPDALAAAPLAHVVGGPVLLVNAGTVPASIAGEIERLGATNAYVVGGTAAIPDTVLAQLALAGIPLGNIDRIAGPTRYDTAGMIAEELRAQVGAPLTKAFIATGESFPDALAAGGWAAREDAPVLLVQASGVPQATDDAIDACGVTSTVVLGGTAAVPAAVMADLPSPTRLSGPDRYETCRLVAEASLDAGLSDEAVYLATGTNFPDALSAGAASAEYGYPVLLVSDPLPLAARTFATDHADTLWNVMPVGGTAVVPGTVFAAFKNLLQ